MNQDARKENDRDVERLLDDALAQYGMIEPRPGLEGRVLARLAEAREHSSRSLWWRTSFAFGVAAVLALALFWFGRLDRRVAREIPVAKISAPPQTGGPAKRVEGSSAAPSSQKHGGQLKRGGRGPENVSRDKFAGATEPNTPPRLEQFPSPLPLNDQERMLALYVREFPQKAALMARAQTELRKQDELERTAP